MFLSCRLFACLLARLSTVIYQHHYAAQMHLTYVRHISICQGSLDIMATSLAWRDLNCHQLHAHTAGCQARFPSYTCACLMVFDSVAG